MSLTYRSHLFKNNTYKIFIFMKTKKIQTESGEILIVEIPNDAHEFEIIKDYLCDIELLYWNGENLDKTCTWLMTYDKNINLEIIGNLSELTDEQCKEFVYNYNNNDNITYPYYIYTGLNREIMSVKSPKESFISLLQSENIDTNMEWLIIKIL